MTEWKRKENRYHMISHEGKDGLTYLTFPVLDGAENVRHLFSTRKGGVSRGIYESMNLSFHRGDDAENVLENFRRIAALFDSTPDKIVCAKQTHTTNIRRVTKVDAGKGVTKEPDYEEIDGLITNEPGLILCTSFADCVPLYFVDPKKQAIGLAHSGWRGTVNRMGARMIEEMKRQFGSNPGDLLVAVGPSICADCYEVGEEVTDEVNFAKFGRRAILNLRQTLASKILELEKDSIYNKYIDKVGTIINAEVYQIWKKEMLLLDDEGNELLLPKTEQIPSDFYRKGETARAVVARVDNKNNNPKIILSRTSPVFLQRLFEMEVPEINDGLITIKKIARIPGERAKIAVESYDDRIDPVGACVGVKGSRIHGIVRELRNENIDVINYTSNISLFIQRALSPAKISSIRLNEEEKKAEVFLKPEEVSLAIGKGGLNIKLASMLTEYTIDVFRELDENVADEDIYLDEFRDEIDGWVIDAIKAIGIDTAKAVLNAPREMLIEKTDLEEETVDEVIRILKSEFEEEPEEEPEQGQE